MARTYEGEGRRNRSSELLWPVMWVEGQSGLHKTLSQKVKGEKMKDELLGGNQTLMVMEKLAVKT